jgi:septal ring factor EnvC (AmiA/AmiB activator)
MESVSDTTAFYDRLFRKLVARENEIESLRDRVDELQEERNRRRDRLSEYLRTLTIN